MAFVDELTVRARAGKGGDGVVRWLNLKGKEYSGPAGGNGGDGGDFYVRGVRDVSLLGRYRGEKFFKAGDGAAGENRNKHGQRGEDFVLDLPVGSIVINYETGERHELESEDQQILILKGGRGGAGNAVFKSSVNQSPMESLPGGAGEESEIYIELRLIADAGFIGLPNAGKTSLLNSLTGTNAKTGAYAFTTLDPNLGALYGLILADIPGLIEGASAGKGLGFKFLRHISRTRLLVHCVSLESDDPYRDYETVRAELSAFEKDLIIKKPELVVLTKSDAVDAARIAEITKLFKTKGCTDVTSVTVLDDESVKVLQDALVRALK